MYYNIERKLKGLAIFVFIIGAIGAIAAGIVLFTEELILEGLLVLVGGCIYAWVSSWVLYGIGEAVEYALSANLYAKQTLEKLTEKQSENTNIPTQTNAITGIREQDEEVKEYKEIYTTFSVTDSGTIICSQCNFEQPGNRICCWHCGAKFENE